MRIRVPPGSADFEVCYIASSRTRSMCVCPADLEVGDTAGWETCATRKRRDRGSSALNIWMRDHAREVPSGFCSEKLCVGAFLMGSQER